MINVFIINNGAQSNDFVCRQMTLFSIPIPTNILRYKWTTITNVKHTVTNNTKH